MENHSIIMASMPYVLGEKKTAKHHPGGNFWKFVPVSLFQMFLDFHCYNDCCHES